MKDTSNKEETKHDHLLVIQLFAPLTRKLFYSIDSCSLCNLYLIAQISFVSLWTDCSPTNCCLLTSSDNTRT